MGERTMLKGVRMYESEQNARDAAATLTAAGLDRSEITILTPVPGQEGDAVRAAIADGKLPGTHVHVATQALRNGQTVLSVGLPYMSQYTLDVMDSFNPVDSSSHPPAMPRRASPFSDFLGLRVLTEGRSRTRLLHSNMDRSFGFSTLSHRKSNTKLRSSRSSTKLSNNPTPLSSMLGLKVLTGRKR
jgi:hypothetical protein